MSEATIAGVGAKSAVALGDESTFGTPVQPTHKLSGFTGESLTAEEETIVSDAIRGDRGVHDIMRGQETVSGDLNFEFSAEGLGKAIYHVMGDYVKAPDCDGGAHGRMETDSIQVTPEDPTGGSTYQDSGGSVRQTIPLAKDHVTGFDPSGVASAGGTASNQGFAMVDRSGANNSLAFHDDGNEGYDYTEYSESSITFVDSSAEAESTSNLPSTLQDSTPSDLYLSTVTLSAVLDEEGNYSRPAVPSKGGLIQLGSSRNLYRVYAATDTTDSNGRDTKKLWIDPNDKTPSSETSSDSTSWADDDFVYSFACLVYDTDATTWDTSWPNTNNTLNPGKGKFVYEYDSRSASNGGFSGVYTHHIERGRDLPTGLTIEVDRDAAVFLYSGMKGSSLSFTFDTNAVATGTATYTGHAEYAMATLEEDLLPDASNSNNDMIVSGVEAFPDPKEIGGLAHSNSTGSTLVDKDGTDLRDTGGAEVGDYAVNLETNEIAEIDSFSQTNSTRDTANLLSSISLSGTGDERYAILPSNDLVDISINERTNIKYASLVQSGDREQDSANAPTLDDGESVFLGVKNVDRFHPKFSNVDCRQPSVVGEFDEDNSPTEGDLRPLTAFETLVNIDGYFEEVLSGDVSIENNINEDKFILGSRRREAMPAEGVDVTGTLSMEFDDGKNYIKFKNGNLFSLEFRLIQESSVVAGENVSDINNTGIPPQAYLLLPKCKYTGNTPTVDDESFIEHDMSFTAKVDDEYNMSTETVMILVNGLSADVK